MLPRGKEPSRGRASFVEGCAPHTPIPDEPAHGHVVDARGTSQGGSAHPPALGCSSLWGLCPHAPAGSGASGAASEGGPAPSPLGETPQGAKTSSGELLAVVAVRPGGGLVVAGARPEAAVQVADEAIAEGAQRLVVEVAGSTPPPVEVVAAGTDLQ